MIVVGFDPGNRIGWCLLDIGGTPVAGMTARWVSHGEIVLQPPRPPKKKGIAQRGPAPPRMADAEFDARVVALCRYADAVAVEDIQHQYGGQHFKSAKAMIAAAKVGERISTVARVMQKPVHVMTASRSRTLAVGRNNPTDATITVAVQRLIRGVPKRTNAHVRDAAVVALAVGWSKPDLRSAG